MGALPSARDGRWSDAASSGHEMFVQNAGWRLPDGARARLQARRPWRMEPPVRAAVRAAQLLETGGISGIICSDWLVISALVDATPVPVHATRSRARQCQRMRTSVPGRRLAARRETVPQAFGQCLWNRRPAPERPLPRIRAVGPDKLDGILSSAMRAVAFVQMIDQATVMLSFESTVNGHWAPGPGRRRLQHPFGHDRSSTGPGAVHRPNAGPGHW
jgi:hypothetical protein